jgi:hypothetical protein
MFLKVIALLAVVSSVVAGTIDNTSLVNPPGVYAGTGNANTNWTVSTTGNQELGLTFNVRGVGTINPGNSNVYALSTGAGPLSPDDFGFSVNMQAGGGSAILAPTLFFMQVKDLTAGTSGPIFDPVRLIPDDAGYGASGKTNGVNTLTEWGAENYENFGFAGFLPGFNASNKHVYQVNFWDTNLQGVTLNSDSIIGDATGGTASPEPTTLLLTGLGLGAIGMIYRKRQ